MKFTKGQIPWNKGLHPEYVQGKNHPMYGHHPTKEEIAARVDKFKIKEVEDMSLQTIHRRIIEKLGQPSYCEMCKKSNKKNYEWSNKDHKYRLRIIDWQRLCRSCHNKYDIEFNGRPKPPNRWKTL